MGGAAGLVHQHHHNHARDALCSGVMAAATGQQGPGDAADGRAAWGGTLPAQGRSEGSRACP